MQNNIQIHFVMWHISKWSRKIYRVVLVMNTILLCLHCLGYLNRKVFRCRVGILKTIFFLSFINWWIVHISDIQKVNCVKYAHIICHCECVLPVGQNAPPGIGLCSSCSGKHTGRRNTAQVPSPDLLYMADSQVLRAFPAIHAPENRYMIIRQWNVFIIKAKYC